MSTSIRRAPDGGIILETYLSEDDALRLANQIREMLGAQPKPAKQQSWVPLERRVKDKVVAECPDTVRTQIQHQLNRGVPRLAEPG